MNFKKWKDIWLKERDEAIRTQDLEKFKAFYMKWKERGLYTLALPSDKVLEISMRKCLYHMASATEEEKQTAKKWLEEHGSSTDLG